LVKKKNTGLASWTRTEHGRLTLRVGVAGNVCDGRKIGGMEKKKLVSGFVTERMDLAMVAFVDWS